jgi:uncharacterized FlaG/YvyC family protein
MDSIAISKTSSNVVPQSSTTNSQPENIKSLLDRIQPVGNSQDSVATISKQAPTPIQDIQKAAAQLNELATSNGLNVQFEVVNNGHKVILVVRDTLDNNVIREIPGHLIVNLSQNFDLKQGVLFSTII